MFFADGTPDIGTSERIINALANLVKEVGSVVGTLAAMAAAFYAYRANRRGVVNSEKIEANTSLTREVKYEAQAAARTGEEAVTAAKSSAREVQSKVGHLTDQLEQVRQKVESLPPSP